MLSIQNKITTEIIEALENGVKPWSCPWKKGTANGLPRNLATGMCYSGINIAILWFQSFQKGFTSDAWLTFNQVRNLNGSVIKGSKGTSCVFYKLKEIEDEDTGEAKQIPLIKTFTVFNLNQIEGVKYEIPLESQFNPIEKGEELIRATQADIQFGGIHAFYKSKSDQIFLPKPSVFNSSEDFYSTALHEIVHWTGHEARLNRKYVSSPNRRVSSATLYR